MITEIIAEICRGCCRIGLFTEGIAEICREYCQNLPRVLPKFAKSVEGCCRKLLRLAAKSCRSCSRDCSRNLLSQARGRLIATVADTDTGAQRGGRCCADDGSLMYSREAMIPLPALLSLELAASLLYPLDAWQSRV